MEEQKQEDVFGWAARDTSGVLFPFTLPKRAMKSDEISLKVLYSGICHTDLSMSKNEWGISTYPVVPGHEVVGVVIEVGRAAHKFKAGDKAGVGYLAGACFSCDRCVVGEENYCTEFVCNFNSSHPDGTRTFGGFAGRMVISERFAVKIPEMMPLDKAAPLMCAGVTVYACADDATWPGPAGAAPGGLGARRTRPPRRPVRQAVRGTMDGVISTSSGALSLGTLNALLKVYGKLILVGVPNKPPELPSFGLISGGKSIAGSMVGETNGETHKSKQRRESEPAATAAAGEGEGSGGRGSRGREARARDPHSGASDGGRWTWPRAERENNFRRLLPLPSEGIDEGEKLV
ncbi:hypothetical protein ZIOFF_025822 [Zingiber officinale]|uniref:cinnamyl-alcohol dehydrogenase n=1 Tax=Zingiber officinale TaxID=94328 RepID=A0A8J5GWF9_ZINOF|nr:hypothetical protein ZIOFF_025822 [Zingiber officinale]